jgi:hypothetical protein
MTSTRALRNYLRAKRVAPEIAARSAGDRVPQPHGAEVRTELPSGTERNGAKQIMNGKPARYSVSPLAGMAAHRRYIRTATGLCAIIEAWPG